MERLPDRGVSLVEVLIAVAIMGLAMTAILGAIGTQISGTRVHRDQSNAAAVLTAAAERVKAAPYALCGSAQPAYKAAAEQVTLPSDWTSKGWSAGQAVQIEVSFWNGSSFVAAPCSDSASGDTAGLLRLQQVTVTAAGPDGGDEVLPVIKSGQAP